MFRYILATILICTVGVVCAKDREGSKREKPSIKKAVEKAKPKAKSVAKKIAKRVKKEVKKAGEFSEERR